jgi:phosphatidylinositol alpha-1,6-mannosyltransferase
MVVIRPLVSRVSPGARPSSLGRRALLLAPDALGGRGGICGYMRAFAAALGEAGVPRLEVLARRSAPDPGVPGPPTWRESVPSGGKIGYMLALLRRAAGPRPDLVVAGHLALAASARLLAARHRAPLVLLAYGIEAWRPLYPGVREAVHAADLVLSISRDTTRRLRSWAEPAPDRIKVLPNPIALTAAGPRPDPRAGARLRERLRLGDAPVLLTVGRMDPSEGYKGHDLILDALPHLGGEHGRLTWLAVGEGADRERLLGRVAREGLEARVRLPGYLGAEELDAAYGIASAFAMPSAGEGFGQVFLEALNHGLPVLGSPGGAEDPLRDGELGLLSRASDGPALANDLRVLLARPRGRPEALACFSTERFRERLAVLLQEVLAEGPGR